jgi:Zn-dependent M28 family amino/carboxypeptidase
LRVTAGLDLAASRRLMSGAPMGWDELVAAEQAGTLRPFALPGTANLAARWQFERLESRNVVARLPGSDPALAAEHVVLTAHLDHIGVGAPVNGDAIYNGALDNAVGVAAMLEAARGLAQGVRRPRRSVLFIALTAEEKGLLGSQYFAEFPTVPAESLVANVNLDMPIILAPQVDVIGIGLEHSSLDDVVRAAARELGMQVSPDPFPEEVVFVRSDQYSFVRRGIPAAYLDGGRRSMDPAVDMEALMQDFLRNHYHQPSDDLTRPIHWESVARFADLNMRIALRVANADQRPRWNAGDFFGERFGARTGAAAP